ncbi:MAG: hypothetical protein HQ477_01290 [Chloroflexi bacterium]|nr:hypothetical protein [Chloroflexota bacterium]
MTDNTDIDEQLLEAILNRLLPAIGEVPAAGQMKLVPEIIRLSGRQARFQNQFSNALRVFKSTNLEFRSTTVDEQDDAIKAFEAEHPELFGSLLTISYIVYYKDSRVHKRIGWSGRTPQPDGNEMEPWDESVLENVRKREPFWRQV